MSLEADALADRRRLKGRLSFWRLLAFVFALIAVISVVAVTSPQSVILQEHIARVDVKGLITGDQKKLDLLRRIKESSRAQALIVSIDSPGGTTSGSEALFEAIREVADEKPVVAVLNSSAASGGYIAAMAADHIVTRGNTITASIGVVFQWPNVQELLDKVGVDVQVEKSSPLKAEPSGVTETPEEAREILRGIVAESQEWFKGLVAERRNLSGIRLERVTDGRVMTGRQAVEAGLADTIGGLDEAKAWLSAEHGIHEEIKIRAYSPDDPLGGFEAGAVGFISRTIANAFPGFKKHVIDATSVDGLISIWHPNRG